MSKARRKFTPEEKHSILQEAERQGQTETAGSIIWHPQYFLIGRRTIYRKARTD
ncbi:MAG: hypothetical protein M3R25_08150 [Bacteroidota bacterium]|nr:hypothetical protein [Bacteroidota bacterium]